MSRPLRALILAGFVAGCGGGSGNFAAPRDLDNACAIVAEHPSYLRAFQRIQRQHGILPETLMAMIYQESKFIGNARTPFVWTLGVIPAGRQSSAYGFSQALDGTWEEYQAATGNRRHRRDDINDAVDFMAWYMGLTVERNGIPLNDVRNQYLAYHDGHSGYSRGTWRRKAWLIRVAGELEQRQALYGAQLRSCT